MKKKRIIRVVIALVVLGFVGRFGWIMMVPPAVGTTQEVQSPDTRYVAKVSSRWRGDFWGRTPHEYHYILVESADGKVIRRMSTDEPWIAWPKDCSIQWATNSSQVIITFKTEEALKTCLILDVVSRSQS